MNCTEEQLRLYGVTDRSWLHGKTLYEQVEAALKGGVTCLQLREKQLDHDAFLQEAVELKELCHRYHVPLIINDNVELAKEMDADGVHVGQGDMQIAKVREILGEDKIIGVTARTVAQAEAAEAAGADYIGSGAVFGSGTKLDAKALDHQIFSEICHSVKIPVVAIGGINGENILQLKGLGAKGAAVVSGIFAQEDVCVAAEDLKKKVFEIID